MRALGLNYSKYGTDGEFFVPPKKAFWQNSDLSVGEYNCHPSSQHSLNMDWLYDEEVSQELPHSYHCKNDLISPPPLSSSLALWNGMVLRNSMGTQTGLVTLSPILQFQMAAKSMAGSPFRVKQMLTAGC